MDKDTKENNSLSILQYNSALFTELMVPLLQGFEKLSILLICRSNTFNVQDFIGQIITIIIIIIIIIIITIITMIIILTFHKPDLFLVDFLSLMH